MATGATIPNMVPGAMPPPPPMGGNMNNPTGTAGGSTTAAGSPVLPNILPGGTIPGSTVPGAAPSSATGLPGSAPISSPIPGNTTEDLTDIYGAGIGQYLSGLMSSGGINTGLLNSVNASELNADQGPINTGQANVNATLGAEGVSANSSTNALATSTYEQGATASENSQIAQNYMDMYNEGQQTLQGILGGVMQNAGDQPNWMDYLGLGENLATTGIEGAMMLRL
jgi:hypothetical protein